jgi:hypothetical protein
VPHANGGILDTLSDRPRHSSPKEIAGLRIESSKSERAHRYSNSTRRRSPSNIIGSCRLAHPQVERGHSARGLAVPLMRPRRLEHAPAVVQPDLVTHVTCSEAVRAS